MLFPLKNNSKVHVYVDRGAAFAADAGSGRGVGVPGGPRSTRARGAWRLGPRRRRAGRLPAAGVGAELRARVRRPRALPPGASPSSREGPVRSLSANSGVGPSTPLGRPYRLLR